MRPRHRGGEGFAPRGIVDEHVLAGASRREQHGVPVPGQAMCGGFPDAELEFAPGQIPVPGYLIDLPEVRLEMAQGAILLDSRSAEAFAERHVSGSVNVGLDGKFASWCGTLLNKEKPIVLLF